MNQTRLTHSSTFRLSAVFAGTSLMTGLLLFALTYWQTKVFETNRISTFIATEGSSLFQVGKASSSLPAMR